MNYLSVFEQFLRLALNGLKRIVIFFLDIIPILFQYLHEESVFTDIQN